VFLRDSSGTTLTFLVVLVLAWIGFALPCVSRVAYSMRTLANLLGRAARRGFFVPLKHDECGSLGRSNAPKSRMEDSRATAGRDVKRAAAESNQRNRRVDLRLDSRGLLRIDQ